MTTTQTDWGDYTPGPWTLVDKGGLPNGMHAWMVTAPGDRASAVFHLVEGEADARLISKAYLIPKLEAALEVLAADHSLDCGSGWGEGCNCHQEDAATILDELRQP